LTPEVQSRYFDKIDAAVDHLLHLLNEVLLIGSIEAQQLRCQPTVIDLEKFCHELIESLQLSFSSQHPIQVICVGNCSQVKVDQTLLQQILSNLLSNAMKYSPNWQPIQLKVHSQDKQVLLQVQDQGIGIPADSLDHVFDAFYRCDNVDRIKGTGLGLAVVKKCVEAHQGEIQVSSQEGVGTTFTVTLPIV
jgi:signal transduction histidine kinase